MIEPRTYPRTTLCLGCLLVGLLLTGCSGFEPYQPRDDREAGPEQGLFSGTAGEFVIYSKEKEP